MMKKAFFLSFLLLASCLTVFGQRKTDRLDRGLIAIQTTNGVYCSWRILGEEYYDVKYNLYRDGTKIASNLDVSNYTDASGSAGSLYTVKAVVRGTEQAASKEEEATVWNQNYLEITPDHGSLTSTYIPNDACMADVDGDGELEILMKFDNASWANTSYQKAGYNGEYFIMEVFKLNGKKLWWVDFGPNMADFQNNEQNIVAYDWDQDGKAEALMRASDGTVIHMADGTTQTIGDGSKNYLAPTSSGQWFAHEGNEFLVYMNGETGKPYQVMEYPLKRLEAGETNLKTAWGDDYGHRSTKHFFGAPYLDGRKPSIFLARGIYTRHKMIALDVDPATHQLSVRWRWNCNDSSSPWYGNGYHNYAIADVDWDGRDEICFGSMVIDDNGKGLSTTGYGHGDAQHHGDFNPYVHGQEIFACIEDSPVWGNNYRDGTTSKVYYKFTYVDDEGRCIAGNFSNDYPGAMAFSSHDTPISCVTADHISGMEKGGIPDNFRIYWDGDLCDEGLNYINGKNTAGGIYKYGMGLIETLTGSMTNNDTKGTPCYQGDILGDWREEVIMRTNENKIRIFTTTIPTEWRNYTLWHDQQYRNAMVWQMCGYNQPPHTSYFLGELEGITQAPPALTMTDRTEISNGGTIGTAQNDKQVLMAETGDMTVSVANGAAPYIFFDNAPSWVQGTDVDGTSAMNPEIKYEYYTHTLTGGAFTGNMRLVKQGDGTLVLPKVTQTYKGNTDVWAGTLQFDGTMESSPLWLNRHTSLISDGGNFKGGIKADYNATIYVGGKDKAGQLTTTTLALGFGSRVVLDMFGDGTADQLTATLLTIEKKDWQYGPQYSTPVIEIVPHFAAGSNKLPAGKHLLANIGSITGSIDDIKIEGISAQKPTLSYEDGKLYINLADMRDATSITWDGGTDGIWDFADTKNFKLSDGQSEVFVTGDDVVFNDQATITDIKVEGELTPNSVTFANNTKAYTLSGEGSIIGNATLNMNGEGQVTINNVNSMMGGVNLNKGTLTVGTLANNIGTELGALGPVANTIYMDGGTLALSGDITSGHAIALSANGGSVSVPSGATMKQQGTVDRLTTSSTAALHKKGAGTLELGTSNNFATLSVDEGTVRLSELKNVMNGPDKIVFNGSNVKVYDADDSYSYSSNRINYEVSEGATGQLYLDSRCDYYGKLTGKGTLTVVSRFTRGNLYGNWSEFEGTVVCNQNGQEFRWFNTYGLPKGTMNIPAGSTVNAESRSFTLGNLTGGGTLATSGTVTIGSLNQEINYTGTFSGTTVIKTGTGSWTFTRPVSGVNSYTFKGGDIQLNSTNSTPLFGSSLATVENEAVLKGTGTVAALAFQSGGTLMPGSYTSSRRYGAIASTGTVSLYAGSKLYLVVYNNKNSNTSRSYLTIGGDLKLNGDIYIELGSSYTPAAGDEIIFWTVAKEVTGNPVLHLPELPAGLYWDTSDLLTKEGKLRVTDQPTGINAVEADQLNGGNFYTLDGMRIDKPIKKGIYIRNGKKIIIK